MFLHVCLILHRDLNGVLYLFATLSLKKLISNTIIIIGYSCISAGDIFFYLRLLELT